MLNWQKKGLVYHSSGSQEWSRSHTQLPIVDASREGRWRIYFATRDALGRSNISYIEVEAGHPANILYKHDRTLLPLGGLGAFDESGIMPLSLVVHEGRHYLYYAGWSLKVTVPYQNSIGLAVSDDCGETWVKQGEGPLFGTLLHEPHFTGTAYVAVEGGRWRIWYQSCTRWDVVEGRPEPYYHLKYAESRDGVHWERRGTVAIDYKTDDEAGICSASVLRGRDLYCMWYCYRDAAGYREDKSRSYRIGFAVSPDGIAWTRKDEQAGIDVSEEGWDSEMIAYPHVLRYRDALFMFYNGNGFGRSGFGYAMAPAQILD